MITIKITKEIYEENKKYNVINNGNIYMTLVDNRPMIYIKADGLYFLNSLEKDYNEIVMDDIFCESMIYYLITEKKKEHINDILNWYSNHNRNFSNAPFSLYDVINCDYDF